jgi:hypothetical protein
MQLQIKCLIIKFLLVCLSLKSQLTLDQHVKVLVMKMTTNVESFHEFLIQYMMM